MGKSAKFTKRVHKKNKSTYSSTSNASGASSQQLQVQDSKKKGGLKAKSVVAGRSEARRPGEPVLGGADYVSLMMGGRAKARQEALKLPPEKLNTLDR